MSNYSKENLDKAYAIFEADAKRRGVNYFGNIVKEALIRKLEQGMTPQEAVDSNNADAQRFHSQKR